MAAKASRKRSSRTGREVDRSGVGRGTVITIGGHEDKEGEKRILREVSARVGSGRLIVATVASNVPDEMWATYEPLFRGLGVRHVHHFDVRSRENALEEKTLRVLDDASVVFFTGGDQLKVTSRIGGTPCNERILQIYETGGTLAGTSAGASVMSETMIVAGDSEAPHRIDGALHMAPGLGLVSAMVIDQHFAERGRIGRLLCVVAQNPRVIGLGIDEDTAAIIARQRLTVLGSGDVYVLDGRRVSYTNLAEEDTERTLSVFNVTMHLLSEGDSLDLKTREPRARTARTLAGDGVEAGRER